MLLFIKGQGIEQYNELISKNSSYTEAFYLDTDANRLYYNGKPTDVRISVILSIDDSFIPVTSYQFTNPDGDTTVIKDTLIPEIENNTVTLRDTDNATDNEYTNGLYSVKDKFLLEAIAKLLGITLKYTYYANVHHIEDVMNGDYDTTRDVIVYQNSDSDWVYDYDSFEYTNYYKNSDGKYVSSGEYDTKNAGSKIVDTDDVRVKSIETVRKNGIQVYFDGGDLDDDKQMYSKHGGLQAGNTVSDLEKKTISDILGTILFETATPVKVNDASAYIKFTDEYCPNKYVEVGATYPSIDDMELHYTPETWAYAIDGSIINGTEQVITSVVNIDYYIKDDQHPWVGGHGKAPDAIYNMKDSDYADHYNEYKVSENDKSSYYAVITYKVTSEPTDSDGSTGYLPSDSLLLGDTSTLVTTNYVHMDGLDHGQPEYIKFDVITGYKIASNAGIITDQNIWDSWLDEPTGDLMDNDDYEVSDFFAYEGATYYAKWTSKYTPESKFYIYLPESYTIGSIGGLFDTVEDSYRATATATIDVDSNGDPYEFIIINKYNVSKAYYRYEIKKSYGITTVKFTLTRRDD